MIRYFCQILYLTVFPVAFLAGCVAMASGPDPLVTDFPEGSTLRADIWRLAGWLGPAQARSAGAKPQGDLFWREAFVPRGEGLPPTRLAMGFSDALSSWPMALEVECQTPGPDGTPDTIVITDARPFGQDNLAAEPSPLDTASGPGETPGPGRPKIGPTGPTVPIDAAGTNQRTDQRADGRQPGRAGDFTLSQRVLESCLAKAKETLASGPYFEPFEWEPLEDGLWRAQTLARYGPRLGTKEIVLVRASPDRFRLAPYHESELETWKNSPGTIKAWAKRLPEAPFLINGGQYYPNRNYMGTLRRQGKDIGGPEHKSYKGFWVQDPLPATESPLASDAPSLASDRPATDRPAPVSPAAALVDRETLSPGELGPEGYGTVIQSYMVLDRLGRIRVKTTELLASRAVLGFDREGWAVCVAVKGAITMSDLALLSSKLGLVSALGLDGGLETQLAFNGQNGPEVEYGRHANNFLGNFLVDDLSPSLPSVIAFERLPKAESLPAGEPPRGQDGGPDTVPTEGVAE